MYIDTHCHLYKEYYNSIDEVIEESKKNGVIRFIVNGCDMKSNIEALELANKYDEVYAAIGFHPTELDDFNDEYFTWLENHINDKKVVAIGEIGLDYHYDNTDKEKEIYVFRKQLDIAKKYNKPIIVHIRDALGDTFQILKEYDLKGSIHAYSGSLEMAYEFMKLGFYISLGGPVTFKNAKEPKDVAINIPLDRLLIETDCPFLSPDPFRGKRNESANVYYVCKKIAELRGITFEEVEKQTEENTKKLFGI